MHRQHDRVPDRIGAGRGLRAEHMRIAGAGHRRATGAARLRAGMPHAGGGRTPRPDGRRCARMAAMRPRPGAAVRVAVRRGFRRRSARPNSGAGPVCSLLLRHRGTPLVRHGRTREYTTSLPSVRYSIPLSV